MLVVRIFAPPQEVLISHVVGTVIDHEAAALHTNGLAAAEERVQVAAVTHALVVTATKVPVLVEDDLKNEVQTLENMGLIQDSRFFDKYTVIQAQYPVIRVYSNKPVQTV